MSVRSLVYQTMIDDADFQSLFFDAQQAEQSLYAAPPDTPTQRRWVVLAWGFDDPPPGRDTTARTRTLTVWAYDRDAKLDWIDRTLASCTRILLGMEGQSDSGFCIMGASSMGQSEDLFDDAYSAHTRNAVFRLGVSG